MNDTSGFYKLDPDSNELYFAPHFVSAPTFELLRETHADHTYPIDGWWWFNSEEEARDRLGLPPAPQEEQLPSPESLGFL